MLITPLKNEEKNLLSLKKTILNQSIKPIAWIIVDSGSEDDTYKLSKEIFKGYDWIYIIKQKKFYEKGYGHLNIAQATNEGFKEVERICKINNIKYDFIGNMDATPIICKDYFKILMYEMNKDKELCITCGIQKLNYKDKEIEIKPINNVSLTGINNIRLCKNDFFRDIGGYPLTPSPDSVLLIKAINRKLKVKVIDEVYFIKPRIGGSKIGIWTGSKLKGKSMYILGYHPLLAFLNAIANSIKIPPYYQFIPMLWGYFISFLKNEEKVSDAEIIEYYGKKRLNEVFRNLIRL